MSAEKAAEYRRKATECRAQAAKAMDTAVQFEYTTMAESWESLAGEKETPDKPGG